MTDAQELFYQNWFYFPGYVLRFYGDAHANEHAPRVQDNNYTGQFFLILNTVDEIITLITQDGLR